MEKKFKILLATDYSEAVMSAERFAVQFALRTNSELTLLHVYEVPLGSIPPEPLEFAETRNDIQKSELYTLEQHGLKLCHSLNTSEKILECEYVVQEGSAANEIRKMAEKFDFDFVVIGTHGASGFKEFFSGSHTWDVIKKAKTPVFAIPKDVLFTGIKNIVYATDYREGEISVINYLVDFAKQFDSNLTILHISEYALSKNMETQLFDKFKTEIGDKLSYKKVDLRLAFYEDVVNGLNDFCLRSKTDLLVLSPEKPFLWENIFSPVTSVTRKMSFHTFIPLLSVPDYYNTDNSKLWKLFDLDESYLGADY